MRKVFLLSLFAVAAAGCSGGSGETATTTTTGTTTAPKPTTAGITSSGPDSTAPKVEGTVLATKTGKLEITAPKGWMKVDPENKEFQDALSKTMGASSMAMFKQVANQVDLMAIDLSKKVVFANNVNIIPQPLPKAITSDADFEEIYKQMSGSMSLAGAKHKIIKFPAGPTLCYSGTISQGTSKNDLIGYLLPTAGTGAYVITFSTAQGNLESFRTLTESMMQSVVLK